MIARLLGSILIVSLVISIAAGCSRWRNRHANRAPEPQLVPAVQQTEPEQAAPKPDTMQAESQAGTAEALAQKTNSYAQTLAALLEKKTANQTSPAPAPAGESTAAQPRASAEKSAVKWADPKTAQVTEVSGEAKAEPGAPVQQTAEAAPSAPAIEKTAGGANQALAFNSSNTGASVKAVAKVDAAARSAADAWDAKLTRQAKDSPRDVGAQLDRQLLHFLQDQPVPQIADLAGLPTEDRELVSAVMDALSNFRSGVRADGNMLLSKKIRPFLEMSERMRTSADLTIPTVALCTKVDGFGNYEPLDAANRFIAGREHPLIVYCEVTNFASQLNDKQLWETKLTQEIVLYTETGLPVWQDKTKTITDNCRNRRHDFFIVKRIDLPANLTIGRYLLKVGVVDQQASRVSEATVPVVIVAQ